MVILINKFHYGYCFFHTVAYCKVGMSRGKCNRSARYRLFEYCSGLSPRRQSRTQSVRDSRWRSYGKGKPVQRGLFSRRRTAEVQASWNDVQLASARRDVSEWSTKNPDNFVHEVEQRSREARVQPVWQAGSAH